MKPTTEATEGDLLKPPGDLWIRRTTGMRRWAGKGTVTILDQGLIAGSNFLLSVLLARHLEPFDFGRYTVAFAILIFFAGSYQGMILIPMTATAFQLDEKVRMYYLQGLQRLLVRLCAGLVVIALIGWLILIICGLNATLAVCVTVSLPALLFQWHLRDLHYLALSPRRPAEAAALNLVVVMTGLILLQSTNHLTAAAAILLLGAGSIISSVWLHLKLPYTLTETENTWNLQRTLNYSWPKGRWEFLSSLAAWLPGQAIFPAVAAILGTAQVGQLKALLNIATPLSQLHGAIHRLGQPYLSGKFAKSTQGHDRKAVVWITLLSIAIGAAYLLTAIMLGPHMLRFLYGEGKFEQLHHLIGWALLPTVISGISVAFSLGLKAKGLFRSVSMACSLKSILLVITIVPLSKSYDLIGPLLATLLADFIYLVCAAFIFLRTTKSRPPVTK